MAKIDDDPDRTRPPQRGNDDRRIGQEKKIVYLLKEFLSGFVKCNLNPSLPILIRNLFFI